MYNAYTSCAHQLCGVHLIRELTAAEQDHLQQYWPIQARSAKAEPARHAGKVSWGECEQIEPGVLPAFAGRPGYVPFTNNLAERGLRPCKAQVKISGCHQSEEGAAAWLGVRSYIDSACKHGLSAFEALRKAFIGDLWTPPIPASA